MPSIRSDTERCTVYGVANFPFTASKRLIISTAYQWLPMRLNLLRSTFKGDLLGVLSDYQIYDITDIEPLAIFTVIASLRAQRYWSAIAAGGMPCGARIHIANTWMPVCNLLNGHENPEHISTVDSKVQWRWAVENWRAEWEVTDINVSLGV